MTDISKRISELLKRKPDMRDVFEKAYVKASLEEGDKYLTPMESGIKKEYIPLIEEERGDIQDKTGTALSVRNALTNRIVGELIAGTEVLHVKDGKTVLEIHKELPDPELYVTKEDLMAFSHEDYPQLTGTMMHIDLSNPEDSESMLIDFYKKAMSEDDPTKARQYYGMFRRGVDMLDLNPFIYEILGRNRNSMSYWLPSVAKAAYKHGFFKIPETRIARVPMPILQMTRLEYESLTPVTRNIVNRWAMSVFFLNEKEDYFIKTGTYSSKFFFRNAHVHGEQEVRELGEYLLFIQNQACNMAGPLVMPSIYGISTTNEWVVREFIRDMENNPTIYHGLPLHTEFRIFVDFDTDDILGISPYWEPELMKRRFSKGDDADSVHKKHDYVTFLSHEEILMARYEENKELILRHMEDMLPDVALEGQWSIDIMQNGSEFYLIDMALADQSALVECVPKGRLKKSKEDWIPERYMVRIEEN